MDANAISEGINWLAYIRSLQAEPPIASAEVLSECHKAMDGLLASLKTTREGKVAGYVIMTSMRISDELIRSIENVRAYLSTSKPGVRLPASLFQLVDLAWTEIEKTTGPIRASPSSGEPPRMSVEEWAAMPEDEPGELVAGRLAEEEMADYEHETIVSVVNATLRGWVVPRGGFVAGSEAKFAVGREQGRKADLSVYLPGGSTPPRHGPIRVPPDIVIEVVSPAALDVRRDRVEKPRDYAAFGVRWIWLIDPALRVLEVLALGSDGRHTLMLAAAEGTVTIPGCDDFTFDLDALWAELARLGQRE